MNGTATTAARRVYQDLRHRILEMEMPPGMRIIERDIAAEHGVSRTPVHEAVQRLAEEGLIEIMQRSGTFVARIPIDQLEEAMLVRTALEIAVVERAARRVDAAGLAALQAILERQRDCVAAADMAGFHATDEAFHATLADIAGFPGVWLTILQAKTQIDRFRRLTLPIEGRMAGVVEEHTAVVEALSRRDPAAASDAMREHLDHVLPVIEATRAFRPDYFVNQSLSATGR
ncbi:GntR family transcriptional regulator [Roseateles sp.]|uniref:GntR family transcriptional regulator n=1 Tax=Roseateles sp. TaxID=1971397 RepID=UPI0025D82B93|nr:GntR family transcriptional regulator [Roseateles sp.]